MGADAIPTGVVRTGAGTILAGEKHVRTKLVGKTRTDTKPAGEIRTGTKPMGGIRIDTKPVGEKHGHTKLVGEERTDTKTLGEKRVRTKSASKRLHGTGPRLSQENSRCYIVLVQNNHNGIKTCLGTAWASIAVVRARFSPTTVV